MRVLGNSAKAIEEASDEPRVLVAVSFRTRFGQPGCLSGVRRGLRPDLTELAVIYVTDLIVVLLFIYLGAALVRPEWF
jgi:F subunit of K+-transporting ATPase (Potass_KdpF)